MRVLTIRTGLANNWGCGLILLIAPNAQPTENRPPQIIREHIHALRDFPT